MQSRLSKEILDWLSIKNPELDRNSPIIHQLKENIADKSSIPYKNLPENISGYQTRVRSIYVRIKAGLAINLKEEIDKIILNVTQFTHDLLNDQRPKGFELEVELQKEKDASIDPLISAWNFVPVEKKKTEGHQTIYFNNFKIIFDLILNYIKPQSVQLKKEERKEPSSHAIVQRFIGYKLSDRNPNICIVTQLISNPLTHTMEICIGQTLVETDEVLVGGPGGPNFHSEEKKADAPVAAAAPAMTPSACAAEVKKAEPAVEINVSAVPKVDDTPSPKRR